MKEVEITLKVKENLEKCIEKLEKQNFSLIRKSRIEDIYMTQKLEMLDKNNIDEILKSCVLLRYINDGGKEYKKITYKNKEFDEFNNIISEKKINVECTNLEKAKELFEALGFKELVRVKYEVTVLSDRIREFCFQEVEGLGLLLEYESRKNMDNYTNDEIIKEKELMKCEIEKTGIMVNDDLDVRKAYELVQKKIEENK